MSKKLIKWLKKIFGIHEGGMVPYKCPACGAPGHHLNTLLLNDERIQYYVCKTGLSGNIKEGE